MSNQPNEVLELFRRYKRKTGQDMPEEIVREGIDRIRRAVTFVEQFGNVTAAAPPVYPRGEGGPVTEESMVEWDKQSEF